MDAHSFYIINAKNKPCAYKPFYSHFKFTRAGSLFYAAINKFLIFFGKLTHKTFEHQKNTSCSNFFIMLCNIIFIQGKQLFLNLQNSSRIFFFCPACNTFRKAANYKIIMILVYKFCMLNRDDFLWRVSSRYFKSDGFTAPRNSSKSIG